MVLKLLRGFLRSSSIHGLQYVGNPRTHAVLRGLWLACVAAGFLAASWVIYMNILQWRDSPAIVADVSSVLVQGKKWNPRITVCPNQPDWDGMTFPLLDRLANQITNQTMTSFTRDLAQKLHSIRRQNTKMASTVEVSKFLDPCRQEVEATWSALILSPGAGTGNRTHSSLPPLSPPCEFLRVLWAFDVVYSKASEDVHDDSRWKWLKEGLLNFVTNIPHIQHDALTTLERNVTAYLLRTEEPGSPSTAALLSNVDLRWKADVQFPPPCNKDSSFNTVLQFGFYPPDSAMSPHTRLLYLYQYFFPVVDGSPGSVLPVMGMPDVQRAGIFVDQHNIAEFLRATYYAGYPWGGGLTMGVGPIDNFLRDGLEHLLGQPRTRLFTSEWGGLDDTLLCLVTAYAATGDPAHCDEACVIPYGSSSMARDACLLENPGNKRCQEYCQLVSLNSTMFEEVSWLLGEALGRANVWDSPLPGCWHRATGEEIAGCWTRVVNEKGVCLTTDKITSSEISSDGLSESLMFPLDMRGKGFSVIVTQANEFTRGKHADARKTERAVTRRELYLTIYRAVDLMVRISRHSGATDKFASMSVARRGCYYPDEKYLEHFPTYSESNCLLECAWDLALEEANCIPWYLLDSYPGSELCEVNGMRLFQKVVDGRNHLDNACAQGCLQDCTRIEYELESKIYDTSNPRGGSDWKMMRDFLEDQDKTNLSRELQSLSDELTASYKPDVTAVSLFVDGSVALEITRTAASTPVDVVSAVGGTLGLFSGFSLISAVEVIYWLGKCLVGKKRRNKLRRETRPCNNISTS